MKTNYVPKVNELDQNNIVEALTYIEKNKRSYGLPFIKNLLPKIGLGQTEYSAIKSDKNRRQLSAEKLQAIVDYIIPNMDINPEFIKNRKLPISFKDLGNDSIVNEESNNVYTQSLEKEMQHLKQLLAEKDKQIELQNEIIQQLKRLIK